MDRKVIQIIENKQRDISETTVMPRNTHNSVTFDVVYGHATETFPEVETIVAYSACKIPYICKSMGVHFP